MRNSAAMFWVAAKGGGRLLLDALGDLSGHSLPYRPQSVMNPATLTSMINNAALPACRTPVAINTVRREPVASVSSNCLNLTLSIEQEAHPVLPPSLFVKLPMQSLVTHWFFSIINSWRLESHFFRHVAPTLPINTPVTYATAARGTRFFLVQENLLERPEVDLFTNPDMLRGPDLEQVRRCLDLFAQLHSLHAGLDAQRRAQILPLDYHPFLSPAMGGWSRSLNAMALQPCLRKRPGEVPASVVEAYRKSIDNWDALLQYWFSEPLSLLHGDSHLGNFYTQGSEMGMLDWQAAHWGKGVRDVQYFLIDSLPEPLLALHERELVGYYVERRAHYGAPIALATAWDEYRAFSFHTLFTIVVSIGYGALNAEQDALMTEILRRAVAAVQRVDYAGWLRDYLSE